MIGSLTFTPRWPAAAAAFLPAWLIFFVPGLVLLVFLAALNLLSDGLSISDWGALPLFLFVGLIGPGVETLMLIAPTVLASKVVGNRWQAAMIGGFPIALLHWSEGGVAKVVVVLWGFVWSAYCYLQLRESRHPFKVRYVFVFGMHALSNIAFWLALIAVR